MDKVKVLIVDTGVETEVSTEYYEKYKTEGITKIVETPKPVATKKPTVAKKKED